MSKPAFFVDGQTEQRSLHKICPGNPIRIIGCNGHTVSLEAIAKRLASHIKLLNNRYYPIVVLIDREGRDESTNEIKKQLIEEISKYNLTDKILIGVCDRMIENWILADQENFLSYISRKDKLPHDNFEGISGKSFIKKYFPSYHETTDGVSLLTQSNPAILFKESLSFKDFASSINELECDWLKNIDTTTSPSNTSQ